MLLLSRSLMIAKTWDKRRQDEPNKREYKLPSDDRIQLQYYTCPQGNASKWPISNLTGASQRIDGYMLLVSQFLAMAKTGASQTIDNISFRGVRCRRSASSELTHVSATALEHWIEHPWSFPA